MHLLVGLGNIGREYEFTRHNYGFLLLDQIIEDYGFIKQSSKFKSEIFSGTIDGHKILAIKPQTFMNLSGGAVSQVANFYKIPPTNIIALHDDLDVEFSKIKAKIGGGHAGHNGLRSLDGSIGKGYVRLRLGISRPENKEYDVSDYVLGRFSKSDLQEMEMVNKKVSDLIGLLLDGDLPGFLNAFYL